MESVCTAQATQNQAVADDLDEPDGLPGLSPAGANLAAGFNKRTHYRVGNNGVETLLQTIAGTDTTDDWPKIG